MHYYSTRPNFNDEVADRGYEDFTFLAAYDINISARHLHDLSDSPQLVPILVDDDRIDYVVDIVGAFR